MRWHHDHPLGPRHHAWGPKRLHNAYEQAIPSGQATAEPGPCKCTCPKLAVARRPADALPRAGCPIPSVRLNSRRTG